MIRMKCDGSSTRIRCEAGDRRVRKICAAAAVLLALLTHNAFAVDVECRGNITSTLAAHAGETITLGEGDCSVATPIVLSKPTEIAGAGEGRTRIRAQRGFIGATAPVLVHDLSIWRADLKSETSTRAIGIHASATPDIERVRIEGFTVGIYIYASASEFGTRANGWRLDDVTVLGSAHSGIIVRGRDANAGLGQNIRAQTNCERASAWVALLGPCAGAVDRSFLGNTWIAVLMATNGERTSAGEYIPAPPFISQGASQHTVWIGPYCERDQSAALTDNATIVLGGLCTNVQGDGLRVDGTYISGFEAVNARDPANVVRFRAGARANGGGTFYELVADAIDKARPLRRKAEIRGEGLAQKCYREDIANQTVVGRICQDGRVER